MSNELTEIVPPPEHPTTGVRNWKDVESELGLSFPADVKWLAETYGEGHLARFFWLRDPRHPEYPAWSKSVRDAQRESANDVDAAFIPVANTDNGDTLWVDAERVVVTEGRGPDRDDFAGNLSTFLAQVLSSEYECSVFPESVASAERTFEPRVRKAATSRVEVALGGEGTVADHKAAFVAAVSDAKAPAGKAKITQDKAWMVQITKGSARFAIANYDQGGIGLSLTFLPEDEAAVRALARSFVEARKLKVTSIASQQKPIWPEGL